MDHIQFKKKQTYGLAIINLVLILAFIGLIVAGCTLSVDRISGKENNWSTNKMMGFLGQPFQHQSKPKFILPKKKSVIARNTQLHEKQKLDNDKNYQVSMNDKKKAILGMFFVMLKNG